MDILRQADMNLHKEWLPYLARALNGWLEKKSSDTWFIIIYIFNILSHISFETYFKIFFLLFKNQDGNWTKP